MGKQRKKRTPLQRLRIWFRRARISGWLVVFALLCVLVYLSEVGLPGFAKRPLVQALRERGVELQFSRLRLRAFSGIVADNVSVGQTNGPAGPKFFAEQADLDLAWRELLRMHVQLESVGLRHGRFELPVPEVNPDAPGRLLVVTNIEARLRLLPNDEWALEDCRAGFAGAQFNLFASIRNASAVRDWTFLRRREPSGRFPARLRRFADVLEKVSFTQPPTLRLTVQGDARDLQSFDARLMLEAPGANTAWGTASGVFLSTHLLPGGSNQPPACKLDFRAAGADTPWGGGSHLALDLNLVSDGGNGVAAAGLNLDADLVNTRWVSGRNLHLALDGKTLSETAQPDASLWWWTNLQPYALNWRIAADEVRAEKVGANHIAAGGLWSFPQLTITNLDSRWDDGGLLAHAQLNVLTREATFNASSDFDVRGMYPILTEKTRVWLDKFSWQTPPQASISGSVLLPEWTNRHPDWRGEVRPTLCLAGQFSGTNVAYLGIPAERASSHFTYTNMFWHLPDLLVVRPEGVMHLVHVADDRTKDYHWELSGSVDPTIFRPLLNTNQLRGFDLCTFGAPPFVEGEINGRLYDHERIGVHVTVALTNSGFRGQIVDNLVAELSYTNCILQCFGVRAQKGEGELRSEGILVDFPAQRIWFTNGYSSLDPMLVARVIGPKTAAALESYQFRKPPVVLVSGYAPLKNDHDADLQFAVDGGPFHWLRFNVPTIAGNIRWRGTNLLLSDVHAPFYDGDATGNASFTFLSETNTDFGFSVQVTNVDLQKLLADAYPRTNRLEGQLSGNLVITHAEAHDMRSWEGFGYAQLRDGFLWQAPIFGILSPVLDSIVPGMGSSRATEAGGPFTITNSVILAETLVIKSTMMRLQYNGTVDFDGRVDARVNAELLRDTWLRLLGVVLDPVSKLFEYKVTGTLGHPKSEPVYMVSKVLFLPFRPFRALEELFSGGSNRNTNNAAPLFNELSNPELPAPSP